MSNAPTVLAAAAAAILTTRHAPEDQRGELGDQRYFVHQHIAPISSNEPALTSYLNDIYSGDRKAPSAVTAPQGSNGDIFQRLADSTTVADTTAAIAHSMQLAMESKAAKPGILFGFTLQLENNEIGYGVIKADLEDDRRFFLEVAGDETWTLNQVEDILPPPQTKYAKYAIAPRPRIPGEVGIRDTQADPDSAADYFLQAIGLVVPRRSGTKRAVAHAAKNAGYTERQIREALSDVTVDTPTSDVIEQSFPDIPEKRRVRLQGTAERPMDTIVANDPYRRKYSTQNPRFELVVEDRIKVTVEGRRIVVELPAGADAVKWTYVK